MSRTSDGFPELQKQSLTSYFYTMIRENTILRNFESENSECIFAPRKLTAVNLTAQHEVM